jgi:hypothetical protein
MMFKIARSLVGLLAGLMILLAACRPTPSDVATETADPNAVFTAAAATANFRMTEIAASTPLNPQRLQPKHSLPKLRLRQQRSRLRPL